MVKSRESKKKNVLLKKWRKHFIEILSRCYNGMYKEHFTPNRKVWKILIFYFLHFLTFFSIYLPIKKFFLVNFEIFFNHRFIVKDIEFQFLAHNFFKKGPNSKIFFFLKFFFFKKNTKNKNPNAFPTEK